jgi:hypothetical protein
MVSINQTFPLQSRYSHNSTEKKRQGSPLLLDFLARILDALDVVTDFGAAVIHAVKFRRYFTAKSRIYQAKN